MDAFIIALRNLCDEIMPILSATCLVCLIIVLIKLIKVMTSVDDTLIKTHKTIGLVDESLEKAQAPLDTAVKLSGGIDMAYDATLSAAGEVKDIVVKGAAEVVDKVSNIFDKENNEEELKEPAVEDTIVSESAEDGE